MKIGTRVWALITVVVAVALVAGGYFLGVSPLLAQQASSELQRQAAKAQNAALEAEIARLTEAEDKLDDYKALAVDYDTLVPDSVDSQGFIRSLDQLSAATGVTITKITVDEFIPYTAPVAEGDTAFDEKAPPPYTDPRINDQNFVIVPISITVTGGAAESLNFVHALQFGPRLVLLTTIDQAADGGVYTTNISAYMYVLVKPGAVVKNEQVDQGGSAPAEPTDGETASARG